MAELTLEELKERRESLEAEKKSLEESKKSLTDINEQLRENLRLQKEAVKAQEQLNTTSAETAKNMANVAAQSGTPVLEFLKGAATGSNALNMMLNAGTTALLGHAKAFETNNSFFKSGAGLVTDYSNSIGNISTVLSNVGSAANKLSQITGFDTIMSSLKKAVPESVIKAFGVASGSITEFIKTLSKSADNASKFEQSIFSMAAATGRLGPLAKQAGVGFKNLQSVALEQVDLYTNLANASGVSTQAVMAHYAELSKIPGALEKNVMLGKEQATSMHSLTAAYKFAAGSGRDVSEVINDLSVAYNNYNIVGEKALNFTSRMSDLTEKLGVPLENVRGYMRGVSEQFRLFGDQTEGSSKILNNFFKSFTDQNLSAGEATRMIGSLTNKMAHLDIAQKAFLSGQTGGPGGLMGGFQIAKMLQEGKVDEVFDKVLKQMQKQMGKIVSLDEAAASPAAAAQMQKQVQTLRQGPLGSFASSDEEAYKILGAFAKGKTGEALEGKEEVLSKVMTRGNDFQEKSYNVLRSIDNNMSRLAMQTDIGNLGMARGLLAGRGTTLTGGTYTTDTNEFVKNTRSGAQKEAAETKINVADTIAGAADTAAGKSRARLANTNFGALESGSAQAINNSDVTSPDYKALKADTDAAIKLKRMSTDGLITGGSTNSNIRYATRTKPIIKPPADGVIAARQDGRQPDRNATAPLKGSIDVAVSGICLDCRKKTDVSNHALAINPSAGQTQKE